MENIPNYGSHMTLKEFIDDCKTGCLIDYDGWEYYATKTKMTDKRIVPSDVTGNAEEFNFRTGKFKKIKKRINIDKLFKYVVWFNK